jgi:hypothetical protein
LEQTFDKPHNFEEAGKDAQTLSIIAEKVKIMARSEDKKCNKIA